jgi:glutathione synthase/RimK-type ligase-like ATP-grasp enzyme
MTDASSLSGIEVAERLNQRCFCVTLDRKRLATQLQSALGALDGGALLGPEHGQLLADTPVFVPRSDVETMQHVVRAIDAVAGLPAYREAVLAWAPEIARFDPGPVGALMGYDFHLGDQGPRLIEVNTNAGGAFINALLANAQRACCDETSQALHSALELERFEAEVVQMFEAEWYRQCSSGRPRRIAIVDDEPTSQYLYPEFRLAQRLLQAHGIETRIVAPSELSFAGAELTVHGDRIDLVYNRLVDFALAAPAHQSLREAYLAQAVVVTPNPHVHARFADKRNLTLLCDPAVLRGFGADDATIRTLAAAIPRTVRVTAENAGALWASRRDLFFKPAAAHGSKGVYRGSKITRGTFASVVEGGFVAQAYVPPSERLVRVDAQTVPMKVDLRLYTYDGRNLLTAARVYRGQATNLRTVGGGFAPVFQV